MKQTLRADARTRVLDAAESLFAQVGLQASVREITAAAGVNLAAVNYHFRSKDKLVAAVLERRAGPVNAARLKMLEEYEAEAAGNPIPLGRILEAFLAPTLELMEKHPQSLRFAARVITDPGEKMRDVLAAQFAVVAQRFHAALLRALHPLSPSEVWLRMGFLMGSTLFVWTGGAQLIGKIAGGGAKPMTEAQVLDRLILYAAAGMRAPAAARGGTAS
jgi:AcrR family transcriptional regulator